MIVVMVMVVVVISVSSLDGVLFIVVVVMAVIMTPAMSVGVVMEKHQSNEIGGQPEATNNANKPGVLDFLRFHQSLSRLQENRHAQCDEEDAIYQSTKSFGSLPLLIEIPRSDNSSPFVPDALTPYV